MPHSDAADNQAPGPFTSSDLPADCHGVLRFVPWPLGGGWPVNVSLSMTPYAYTSVLASSSISSHCSGLIYCGVPDPLLARMYCRVPCSALASPTSAILATPAALSSY